VKTYPDCVTKNRPFKWLYEIPMAKIPYTKNYYINPTDVAAEALRGNKVAYSFLQLNMDKDGGYRHYADMPYYNLKSPWTSAVSQALAAMAFIEYDEKEMAKKALDFMIKNHLSPGGNFITEKADKIILNGWMIALIALHRYFGKYHDSSFELLFDKQVGTLQKTIGLFMFKNGWSMYDETGIPATKFYHDLHKELYTELSSITGRLPDIEFTDKNPKIRRFIHLAKKHHIKMLPIYVKMRMWKND